MTQKEELSICRSLLIRLHTARWTGNNKRLGEILDAIGAYSYARTNSNAGDYKREEEDREKTLINLKNC